MTDSFKQLKQLAEDTAPQTSFYPAQPLPSRWGLHHPPFLDDVSRKAQKHYYRILFNETLSIAEQRNMIMVWAKKNNVTVGEMAMTGKVKSFYGKMGKRMEEMNHKVAKLIDALPVALKNLTAIMKNENQTILQFILELFQKFINEAARESTSSIVPLGRCSIEQCCLFVKIVQLQWNEKLMDVQSLL
ncbi:unnamed protein product [Haemonchus placei]|uniref:DUF148 domain-containing protein n=1 Tax=Haemonchus placei TaxID=6290 RepID=A0A0N4X6M7_HAEPC|nr:unnamed protein product [Haemonchus placei]